ncbi:haloacid dehalogenase [Peptococcaceae bacterium SCADC1_2_3]|jgi:pyrophosphatase PpaX|nr:haloacid dehalogenase [Peptococcaceae bacterium SCADC1_2_3]KFI35694.1 haloacid dehalogenase [Peptococcaceae bacterium SCADC1_2_3]KFI37230.1 haloacid dehalogenase [Peptococcaceae bacterium SCADC1_2_3]HBQ28168.1 haloacid dehalogenase [Desulfotomaculum sp.]HCJ79680.1 haloacid dehalogenase [Desulfotomaculum sp.]
MQTKVVLFDLDGTLMDSLTLIKQTYERVFSELNIPWGNADVIRWIGLPLRDIARHFAKDKEEEFLYRYQEYYFKEHDNLISLFPGTAEMLKHIHKHGIRTGIVTSKGKMGTELALKKTKIEKYLEVVITAQDVTRPKPQPDPIREALRRLEGLPSETIYIGDSYFDIIAGQRAGTKTLGVTWGITGEEEMRKMALDGILRNWEELDYFL